jgi:hypothetical protein
MSFGAVSEIGQVLVQTTDHRGFTAEEIADRAVEKIIYVGEHTAPEIARSAREYKGEIHKVLVKYLQEAQDSERKTIREQLSKQGYPEIAQLIGEL